MAIVLPISANICYFHGKVSRFGQASPKTMKSHRQINILNGTWVPLRNLMKYCKNDHFRWSVSGEAGPCWDCSRCRRARHWAPWATKCGNTHFHCNALMAPSWQLRRPTGQHAHKCRHLSVKIANTGRYACCLASLWNPSRGTGRFGPSRGKFRQSPVVKSPVQALVKL